MADIELVIKIPEEDYNYIAKKHCFPSCDDRTLRKKFYEMVVNGTPLQKEEVYVPASLIDKFEEMDINEQMRLEWECTDPNL